MRFPAGPPPPLTLLLGAAVAAAAATIAAAQEAACGVQAGSDSRVVGGQDLGGYRLPWYAALHPPASVSAVFCGGTLVSERYVLTAAHCVQSNTARISGLAVTLGMYDRCVSSEPQRREFAVGRTVVHPQYTASDEQAADIALLGLTRSATGYSPACLPPPTTPEQITSGAPWPAGEAALVAGFGSTQYGRPRSAPCRMRGAIVTVLSQAECMRTLLPPEDSSQPDLLCAGRPGGGADSCQGDSGGGLIVPNSRSRFVVVGVVSSGYGCGEPGLPGLYTRVSAFLPWMQEEMAVAPGETAGTRGSIGGGGARPQALRPVYAWPPQFPQWASAWMENVF